MGGGHNPAWGRDTGPPPPTARQPFGYPIGIPQQYSGLSPQVAPSFFAPPPPPQQQQYHPGWNYGASPSLSPPQAPPPMAVPNVGRHPTGQPVVSSALPAANMTNSTGGVGCEPGYNYFFPSEHTKIHVFQTGDTPPWNLPESHGRAVRFHAVHVPVNTTIGDLLRGFGATNPDPKKNRVFEVHQGGNGKWYKGLAFSGDDSENMDRAIKEVGWDQTRAGLPGGKPVVYLYVTNG